MQFTKADLFVKQYMWSDNKNIFSGNLSRRKFNKNNGSQVLFLINHYAATEYSTTQADLLQLELFIAYRLSESSLSEISVFKHILEQFIPGTGKIILKKEIRLANNRSAGYLKSV